MDASEARSRDDPQVRFLYDKLLEQWNNRNAVGFDGSQMNGKKEAETALSKIFADHVTAAYVGIVREVRFLSPAVAILRAVAGMVPPGASDINPAVNAVQTLVAVKQQNRWRIVLFQNTPAAFHGRPELSEQLSEELRQVLLKKQGSPSRTS